MLPSLLCCLPIRAQVVEDDTGKVIEEIEAGKAFFQARSRKTHQHSRRAFMLFLRFASWARVCGGTQHSPMRPLSAAAAACLQVYEGGIYMHQSRTYICTRLDIRARVARVRPVRARYYTAARHLNAVRVVGRVSAYPDRPQPAHLHTSRGSSAQCCLAEVETSWQGYVKIWRGTGEVFDEVDQPLPANVYETVAAWIRVPDAAREAVAALPLREEGEPPRELRAGLHAAAHAVLNALPLYVMCSGADVGTECANPADVRYRPQRILVYDKIAGGSGLCSQAAPVFAELLQAALELIDACPCTAQEGCPGCVWHLGCGQYNQLLDKEAGRAILRETIAAEDAHRGAGRGGSGDGAEGLAAGGGSGGGFQRQPAVV